MKLTVQFVFTSALAVLGLSAQCTLFVAPGGSDANLGTQTSPLASPARAMQIAAPGAVVCLRAGSYPIAADLVILTPLTVQSYPGEKAVLSGVAGSAVGNIVVILVGNVTLQDLEISGAGWYGIFVSSYYTGQPPANVHIRRCNIHHTGHIGIKAYQADSIVVEDSEVSFTGLVDPHNAEGINIMAAIPAAGDPLNQGATVRRNYVHDVAGFGIYLKAGTQRGVIERNRIQKAGAGGIILGGDSGPEFMRNGVPYECVDCIARNNVVSDTQTLGLSCWGAKSSRFYNNTVVNVAQSIQAAFFGVPNSAGTGCTDVTVENNVFVMSSANRMVHIVNPGPGMYLDNNSYFNPIGIYNFWLESPAQTGYWDFNGWRTNTGNDTHSTSATDPILDATNGYKPGSNSPLVDAGRTVTDVVDDFLGAKRPQGSAYDIGAYEVQGASTGILELAQGKAASQSSTYPLPTAGAAGAVDGNTDGTYWNGSVTHTNGDTNAWWQVDLGASATVNSIVIWNRTDCCSTRLSDYWVFVSNTPFSPSDTPATLQSRAGTWSNHQTIMPNPSTTITVGGAQGRYVRVQLSGTDYLSLAEVQVMGTGGSPPAGSNLAQGKAASQTSTYPLPTAGAAGAVDGNTDGIWNDGSVTATNLDTNASWQVDLRASASVSSIVVWNRIDCCSTRLSDYWVFVSNTPFNPSDTPATLHSRAGTWSNHQIAAPNPSTTIAVGGATARYVRVQLTGTNYLSLAEVQVMGTPGTPPTGSNLAKVGRLLVQR